MSAETLAKAQLDKAVHASRCSLAQKAVNDTLAAMRRMIDCGGNEADLRPYRDRLIERFTAQVDLLVEGVAVDRAVREASRGKT